MYRLLLLLAVTCANVALAQADAGKITIQGSFRTRLEVWDWFDGAANDSYAYSGNVARIAVSQSRTNFDWTLEMEAPVLLGLPEDAVAPGVQGQLGLGASYYVANNRARNAGMAFAKQAFVRFKRGGHSLRLGRFEFQDAGEVTPKDPTLAWVKRERVAQRLIGPFGWSHVGRSFDGGHYTYDRGRTNVTVVGAVPTRGAFQVDGWGNLSTGFAYAALTRQAQSGRVSGDYRLFGIYYQDWRHVLKTDNRPLGARSGDFANIRIGTFGGHALDSIATAAGKFDTMFWFVGQTGKWGRLDQRSWGIDLEAGWQPKGPSALKPWVRGGFSYTSGDNDPTDSTHGTFFQMLPTPRPYARFPFFNMMNNQDAFGMVLLRPHKALTLRSEVHSLRLSSGNDLWYVGGGAFQPWTFGYVGRPANGRQGLATLYDISADVAASQNLAFTAYYGRAQGGDATRTIYPAGKNANFGYVEMTVKF